MGRQQSEKAAQVRLLPVLPRHRGPARAEGEVNADVVAGHRQDRKITDPRVGIWLVAGIINQLPHWWHIAGRYLELYNLCMESRPPSETVMEWLDHIRGCQEV